jgi:transketolase
VRDALCEQLLKLYRNEAFIFLTGDLGFQALEPLQAVMHDRFINAGIAEQNMISVAAGLASQGHGVWAYSIAPFCYARPFEQVRNDICHHHLPVKLVGNGGGYHYGPMGASHHAIEDYGVMTSLPHMRAFIPAFAADIADMVPLLARGRTPVYLRLGRCERPKDFLLPPYHPWRLLWPGDGPVVLGIGPLIGSLLQALIEEPIEPSPEVWSLTELPLESGLLPDGFLASIKNKRRLCVIEEHVCQGSVGQALAYELTRRGIHLDAFEHVYALGYPSGQYGSQHFHRSECGLDAASLHRRLKDFAHR